MTPERLLRELEKLPYSRRMRRMVEVGRAAARDKTLAQTLASLQLGGFYERQLALQSCYGSRDGEHVLRSLADPSRLIRGLALSMVPHVCDDGQVRSALELLSIEPRRRLLKRLHKRRQSPVDGYIAWLAARDDPDLVDLLPYGSADLVRELLDGVAPELGGEDWRRLARLHPRLAEGWFSRLAGRPERVGLQQRYLAAGVLPLLVKKDAGAAMSLVRAFARARASLLAGGSDALSALAQSHAGELADLVLEQRGQVAVSFDQVAHRIQAEKLVALLERHGETLHRMDAWFPKLSPEQRLRVYAARRLAWYAGQRYGYVEEGRLDAWLVALLPGEAREREARRHLALPLSEADPARSLPYAAFLPWDEARALLEPYLRNPSAELRGASLSALIEATRYQRARLSDVLAVALARRHEQDPVRGPMLQALAGLPPASWKEDHLDALAQVIRHALDAKDLSPGTAISVERLLVALLPFHPDWAATWLATLLRERESAGGGIAYALAWDSRHWLGFARAGSGLQDLGNRLDDELARRIAPVLLPVLRSWEAHEQEEQVLAFARGLGRRLPAFEGLTELLERLARGSRQEAVVERAIGLLLEYSRDAGDALLADLLRKDRSLATLPAVYAYLHSHRQDLLAPFLGQTAYKGRFSSGKTRFVPPLTGGFHKWTASQQSTFARTMSDVIGDKERGNAGITTAVKVLAAMPAVPHTRLVELASLTNVEQVVRDTALAALGTLDTIDEGVPALLDALGDERARTAIYALRRALLATTPGQAMALLDGVRLDGAPVTVVKEVVRLLGDLKSEEAHGRLVALDGEDLHRDVRAALVRALWNYLERDETWPIVERAAVSPDPALASVAVRTAAPRLSRRARERLVALLARLLEHQEVVVRLEVMDRCARLPVEDSGGMLLSRLLGALESDLQEEVSAAAGAAFRTCREEDAGLVAAAIERLLAPARRRALQTTVQALRQQLYVDPALLSVSRRALDALRQDPLTSGPQVNLAMETLPPSELHEFFVQLDGRGGLHADSLQAAIEALAQSIQYADPGVDLLEQALGASGDERLRRLGLAALRRGAEIQGWTDERLARLAAYQADASPLVAEAAQFTFPPASGEHNPDDAGGWDLH